MIQILLLCSCLVRGHVKVDGMDVHPDALAGYLETGWVVMETQKQTGGGPTLKDTTAESGHKKAAKKAEVK